MAKEQDLRLPAGEYLVHVCVTCFDEGNEEQEALYWSQRKQLALEIGQEILDIEVARDPLSKALVRAGANPQAKHVIKAVEMYLQQDEAVAYIDNKCYSLKELSNLQFRKFLQVVGDEVERRKVDE